MPLFLIVCLVKFKLLPSPSPPPATGSSQAPVLPLRAQIWGRAGACLHLFKRHSCPFPVVCAGLKLKDIG